MSNEQKEKKNPFGNDSEVDRQQVPAHQGRDERT